MPKHFCHISFLLLFKSYAIFFKIARNKEKGNSKTFDGDTDFLQICWVFCFLPSEGWVVDGRFLMFVTLQYA